MYIEKKYLPSEKITEIKIHDLNENLEYYKTPKIKDIYQSEYESILERISSDVNIFSLNDEKNDLIILRFGKILLQRFNIKQEDVEGRLLSKTIPFYYNLFKEPVANMLKTKKEEKLRLMYFKETKLQLIINIIIISDHGKIYIINNYSDNLLESNFQKPMLQNYDQERLHLMEYISQSGSVYKHENRYTWTPGIYSILNRSKRETDKYYNIIFNLVVDEDKYKIKKLLEKFKSTSTKAKETFKIKTESGIIKHIECHLYPKYDQFTNFAGTYGFFKDVSGDLNNNIKSPIDYLLNGFMYNEKIALLIEPFDKAYSFSEGFYSIINVNKKNYKNTQEIYKNIAEKDIVEKLKKVAAGETNKFEETLTYYVNGSKDNKKTCELLIENFKINNKVHSIGFLVDITKDIEKIEQMKLVEKQRTIIKEVHHRIKNNLQILNSFINLEKRAYSDNPMLIIEHMQNRINSLAVLHAQTYNSSNFEILNLKKAIDKQDESLNILLSEKKDITFISNIDSKLCLPISLITPILLIINELATNSAKYAFNENKEDKIIYKTVKLIDENTCEFTFKDNGCGIKNIQTKTKGLGIIIVESLVRQINGRLERTPEHGNEFKIIFPINQEYVGYN